MKLIKSVLTGLFALVLIIVLNTKFGDIPPLAKFLDPFQGFWKNAEPKNTGCKLPAKYSSLLNAG